MQTTERARQNRSSHPHPLRILSLPDRSRENPYIDNWYTAVGIRPCLHIPRSRYKATIFDPEWLLKRSSEIDVIHYHWKFDRDGLIRTVSSFHKCRQLGIRLIWTAHEIRPHDESSPLVSYLIKFFLARYADRIVVHSRFSAAQIKAKLFSNSSYTFVEFPDHDINRLTKEEAKSILGEHRFMFLCLGGNLKPYKGVQLAIDAFECLGSSESVLWIVGVMPRRNPAILHIKSNGVVLRTGYLSEDELSVVVGAADICILPYQWCTTSATLNYVRRYAKFMITSTAGCFEFADNEGIRFHTQSDLVAAMRATQNLRRENDITSPPNIYDGTYRDRVRAIYEFKPAR